jgi:adenylate cyclase, class 2
MSWFEVETKVGVKDSDVKEVKERIKQIASYVKTEHKKDDYYSLEYFSYPEKSLRVRDKGTKREVNFKQWKNYSRGVHVKKEVQFKVSDLEGFFELIKDFGFKKWIGKEKKTSLFRTKQGVNIELNHVKKLGWFLEIEYICREKDIEKARKKVIETRKRLGFDLRNVEKRGYTKMLWDLIKLNV